MLSFSAHARFYFAGIDRRKYPALHSAKYSAMQIDRIRSYSVTLGALALQLRGKPSRPTVLLLLVNSPERACYDRH